MYVCVCARAHMCMCVCVCARAWVYACEIISVSQNCSPSLGRLR